MIKTGTLKQASISWGISGDAEEVDKFTRRLVKVTKDHVAECKKLLQLMGIPYIEAPCEAEAQCAALVCIYFY